METKLPRNQAEFMKVSGVGQAKQEKYATVFLKEIDAYILSKKSKVSTHQQSYDLFKEGLTIQEIVEKRELSENTIYGHLLKIHSEGEILDLYQFIKKEEVARINIAKKALSDVDGLKPFFEYFKEQMPYWKIKMGLYLLQN